MRIKTRSLSLLLALCLLMSCALTLAGCGKDVPQVEVKAGDVVVSPTGNDQNDGSVKSPVRTLARAKELVNQVAGDEPVTVWLRGGVYTLEEPLSFAEADRGNLTFKAYGDEKVTVSGGRTVTGFTEETYRGITVWTAPVDFSFNTLYKEDRALTVARYPDTDPSGVRVNRVLPFDTYSSYAYFLTQTNAVILKQSDLSAFAPEELTGARFLSFHYWTEAVTDIKRAEVSGSQIRLEFVEPARFEILEGDRCVFENFKAGLSVPGEWYLDRDEMKVYYVPFDEDKANGPEALTLYAGNLLQLMTLDHVHDVRFENIRFAYTDFDKTRLNLSLQAASEVDGTVEVIHSKDVVFDACTFCSLGQGGILTKDANDGVRITNCTFRHIGASPIRIGKKEQYPTPCKNLVVENNLVTDYGWVNRGAVGIFIQNGSDTEISHNEITDGYYSGISCGWVWGYADQAMDNVKIHHNLIHGLGKQTMSDMAGIYTLGEQPGTEITYNIVYDVQANTENNIGWGIYSDEGTTGVKIAYNVSYGCSNESYFMHYGKDCTLYNNIFLSDRSSVVRSGTEEEHRSAEFRNNIIYAANEDVPLFMGYFTPVTFGFDHNFYWGGEGRADELRSLVNEDDFKYHVGTVCDPYGDGWTYSVPMPIESLMPGEDSETVRQGFETWDLSTVGLTTPHEDVR